MKNADARKYLLGFAQEVSARISARKYGTGLRRLSPKVESFDFNEGFYVLVAKMSGATFRPHFVVSLENYRTDAEYQIGYGVDVDFKYAESMTWLARALESRYGTALLRTDADLDSSGSKWLPRSRFSLGREYARPILYAHESGESAGYFRFVNQDVPFTPRRYEEAAQVAADFAVATALVWDEKVGTRKRKTGGSGRSDADQSPESLEEAAQSLVLEGGQGFQVDAVLRKVIEDEAVRQAIRHYEEEGYRVTVHGKPFDLECRAGRRILFVEVKGTTTAGEKVFLTTNEVAFARENAGDMELFILSEIKTSRKNGAIIASGGRRRVFPQWDPDVGRLRPLLFSYQIPL